MCHIYGGRCYGYKTMTKCSFVGVLSLGFMVDIFAGEQIESAAVRVSVRLPLLVPMTSALACKQHTLYLAYGCVDIIADPIRKTLFKKLLCQRYYMRGEKRKISICSVVA